VTSYPDDTIDHGRRTHNMVATRDDVLAMAVPTTGTTESQEGLAGPPDAD
jgi:hypothetical protein